MTASTCQLRAAEAATTVAKPSRSNSEKVKNRTMVSEPTPKSSPDSLRYHF